MIEIDGISPDRIFLKDDKEVYRVYLDGEMIWPTYTSSSNHYVDYTWHDKSMTFGVVETEQESPSPWRPFYTWNEDSKTVNILYPPKDAYGEEEEPYIRWITDLPE